MKRLMISLIVFLVLLPNMTLTLAQSDSDSTVLDYSDEVAGEISNRSFEVLYTFEGQTDDMVVIQMIASENASMDPYLYLTTLDNEILAQNDDFFNLNSRIIARLRQDRTYQIVATRNGQRSGSGEGAFRLSLEKVPAAGPGITLEGQAAKGETPPTHVFVPDQAGIFTVTYQQIRGDYFPSVMISKLTEGSSYEDDVAMLSARGLRGGQITLEIELDAIYIISLEETYFDSGGFTGATSVYTVRVELVE